MSTLALSCVIAVLSVAAGALGDELAPALAVGDQESGTCDDSSLLQQSSTRVQQRHLGAARDNNSSKQLTLLQWNIGHPTSQEEQSLSYVQDLLSDGAPDFFNVVNLIGFNATEKYGKVTSVCTEFALTTVIYNTDRWQLENELSSEPQKLCLSDKADPAVVARFKPTTGGGPKLVVVGAHFALGPSSNVDTLKARLQIPSGYEVVFLADTNAFLTSNEGFADQLGIQGDIAQTPTNTSTCCYMFPFFDFFEVPPLSFFMPDRIITTLQGNTPITVIEKLPKPSMMGMHRPIQVTVGF